MILSENTGFHMPLHIQEDIGELIEFGLLVLYRSEIAGGRRIAYYKSIFRSVRVSYEGVADIKVEAEPNQDALERLSMRFYDL